MEYEIEAEFIHDSCATALKVLPTRQLLVQETMLTYYIENNQQCKSGDLILIDAGSTNYSVI
jgi:Xaa-Pro aminopeptidase